jgi:hypothetical protein
MRLQINKHSYFQTANTEQQTRNTKWNYGIKTYSKMMKLRNTGQIVSETTKNNNRETDEEEPLTEPVKTMYLASTITRMKHTMTAPDKPTKKKQSPNQ